MEKYQALAELFKDEATAKEILSDSVEETQQNLKKYDLDFSAEELEEIAAKVVAQEESGELNEDALEDVAGGVAGLATAFIVCQIIVIGAGHVKKWLNRK